MRIALFVGCYNDTLFPETGKAVVTLLERLGHEVEVPLEQTCCGQMHLNTGYREQAAVLARRFTRIFAEHELVVSPSGSCVAMVRERFATLAAGEPELEAEVARLVPRVLELSELLVGRLGVEDVGASFAHRVVYHPTCHSLRSLRVGDTPVRLLRRVRGLELVELADAEECCGFGGTFAVKNAAVSTAMLDDKLRNVRESGADVLCSSDTSCLMHLAGGLRRQASATRTVHLAEILAS